MYIRMSNKIGNNVNFFVYVCIEMICEHFQCHPAGDQDWSVPDGHILCFVYSSVWGTARCSEVVLLPCLRLSLGVRVRFRNRFSEQQGFLNNKPSEQRHGTPPPAPKRCFFTTVLGTLVRPIQSNHSVPYILPKVYVLMRGRYVSA